MTDTYFLDIPVYRVAQARYRSETDSLIEKAMYPGPPQLDQSLRKFHARNPSRKEEFHDALWKQFGVPWQYNDIIGYLRLYVSGSQIRGEYWQVNAMRIRRSKRKVFERKTSKLVHELEIPRGVANAQIYEVILEYVSMCGKHLRGRYLDTRNLEVLGSHIDWNSLVGDA